MKFENQYLTYTEYRLLGGKMEIMPFNLLEFKVRQILDKRTQRRLLNVEEIPQEVKLCINDMINSSIKYINDSINEENARNNIASESIDGYSVTYITTDQIQEKMSNIIKAKASEYESIMIDYLSNVVVNDVSILYLGVI